MAQSQKRLTTRHRYLLICVILCVTCAALSDTITFKDGSKRVGEILNQENNIVQFRDPTYGVMQIPRSQIADISTESASADNPEVLIGQAEAAKKRGDLGEALNQYIQAAKLSMSPDIVAGFHATFKQLADQAATRLSGMPDQARNDYKAMYSALADPTGQKLFSQGNGHKTFQEAAQEVTSKYAQANVLLAQRMQNNMSMRAQVQALYREAVSLTQNQNLDYLLGYAEASRNNNDLDTAYQAYKTVVASGKATDAQSRAAYDGFSRVQTASNGRLMVPTPAAGATAVPVAPPRIAMPSTAPVIVPTSVVAMPASPPLPVWKQTWNSMKDGSAFKKALDFIKQYVGEDALLTLGILIGLFFVLWVLPYQILKFMARRGDTDAGERLYRAKKLGLLSFAGYLKSKASQAKATRHRCPFCNKSIDNMEEYKDLNFIVCPHCREPITPIYEMRDYVDHLIAQLKLSQKASAKGKRSDVLIEKDGMLKLVRGVLAMAIRRRASDFHLETANDGGNVRARIDGIMYDLITLPREITPAFISALKVMANLDITERRVPQDGKVPLWLDQKDYDLRINTSPASMGEKVVIRILSQDAINISPQKLGLDGTNLEIYERNIHKPHGVIIVTGPSGSGKSTTLYVALNELNSGDKNIVTIEDPIEYKLKGLSQMQVNPIANFTFANGLRSILRQDPDVIMVGEVRDKETAEAALDAAMTGHMVLTTLHTIDAPSAFSRMHDLGIEQARVANAVNLVIAQRLVRTVCSDCRKTYKPKEKDIITLGLENADDIRYVHGTGCETCMNTGYYGRLAVFEMLELNDGIRSRLEASAGTTSLRETAKANGMRSLRDEGIRKVREGLTTVEEVIRVTT